MAYLFIIFSISKKQIKSFLNNYFGFNRQQRNGLYVLVLISFALLILRLVYPIFVIPDKIIVQNLPLLERKADSAGEASRNISKGNFKKYKETAEPFVFDPNTVTLEQLLQLGFREKTAQIFLKFRNKGFVFKEKTDLKKVYGISDKFYTSLEPYILITQTSVTTKAVIPLNEAPKEAQLKKVAIVVELNSTDSAALVELNGIGASYAKRILKYRSILGGYAAAEQLKEVYGFTEELYEKIRLSVTANVALIKKINLNKDDFKTINKHPYLSYELSKSICDWRRKTIINATNLKDILNDNLLYQKLLPYLIFD